MSKNLQIALWAAACLAAVPGCDEPQRQQQRATEERAEANRKIMDAQAEAARKTAAARAEAEQKQAEADSSLRKAAEEMRDWATSKLTDYEREFSELQASFQKKGKAMNSPQLIAVRARIDGARARLQHIDAASAQGIEGVRQELRNEFDQVRSSIDAAKKDI